MAATIVKPIRCEQYCDRDMAGSTPLVRTHKNRRWWTGSLYFFETGAPDATCGNQDDRPVAAGKLTDPARSNTLSMVLGATC
jgi:hypothetical protein